MKLPDGQLRCCASSLDYALSMMHYFWCETSCHTILGARGWRPLNSRFHDWFLPANSETKKSNHFCEFTALVASLFWRLCVPAIHAFHSLAISYSEFPLWFFPATQANVPAWIRWDYRHDWLVLMSSYCWGCWRCYFHRRLILYVDRLPIYHPPISDILVARIPNRVASAFAPSLECRWTSEKICKDSKHRKINAISYQVDRGFIISPPWILFRPELIFPPNLSVERLNGEWKDSDGVHVVTSRGKSWAVYQRTLDETVR